MIEEDKGDVSMGESVAIFLYIVSHNTLQMVVANCFQHSLETIYCRSRIVLRSIHALGELLRKLDQNSGGLPADRSTYK